MTILLQKRIIDIRYLDFILLYKLHEIRIVMIQHIIFFHPSISEILYIKL